MPIPRETTSPSRFAPRNGTRSRWRLVDGSFDIILWLTLSLTVSYLSQLAFESQQSANLTTLTTTNAETLNGVIQGLLYVPTIDSSNSCSEDQYDPAIGLPRNVTRRSNLPPTNYKLVAIAPWFSKECTQAYLKAARYDPVRAFIFYKPNNSTKKPQDVDEPIWDLDDGGAWMQQNKFPIFAIPGREGNKLVDQLSQYSGSLQQVPFGEEIIDAFGPNPRDYVRIWTELTMKDTKSMPALWTFFVIVIGALLLIIVCVSVFMHFLQRQRRKSLALRVKQGEVDLEAMGIARVMLAVSSVPAITVDVEIDSAEGKSKHKLFSKRTFSDLVTPNHHSSDPSTKSTKPPKEAPVEPQTPVQPMEGTETQTPNARGAETGSPDDPDAIAQSPQNQEGTATESEDTVAALPPITRHKKSRRNKPRELKLAPIKGPPLSDHQPEGRKSPSDLARARMKHLARPLDDEDDRPLYSLFLYREESHN
ncbi:hypothetical protein SAPIO_CDS5485 [Scedosporium apiospermum]|uniref:Ring finger domain-containing protein n=1 Tax=Pseudallescheria apiosperma TaxID=563466 RepID=A0A084G4R0_PSEDA|nr:uncharacterized protein SAPIO_CDS5485 [Scedosporium apiospermum]KEZ42322.1 hypothetical protein SAPIO_CDS5485 [Scedosporium apiospermum]